MNLDPSLLNRINSKYILKSILSLAYNNMKSVFNLIKHNKSLMEKLDINNKKIKEYFKYNLKIEIKKKGIVFFVMYLIKDIIVFIIFLIYLILYYTRGKFNEKTLVEKYDKKMKKFVDIMDKYILSIYLGIIIIAILINALLCLSKLFALKGESKAIFFIFPFFDLFHYILYLIKYDFTDKIIKELKDRPKYYDKKDSNLFWFEDFDTPIIIILPLIYITFSCGLICDECRGLPFKDDEKIIMINQLNGINIIDYTLPSNFFNLDKKSKIETIFKEDHMKKYQYKLKENQIGLIRKINDIRSNYNVPPILNYGEVESLPDFIINLKTELIFYPNENLYKLSSNYYIFKYPKNIIHNLLNKEKILNIITIDFLNEINIIEQDNFELISIYKNISSNNNIDIDNNRKNDINDIKIRPPSIKLPNIEIVNTEDRLKDTSLNLDVTNINEK